MTNFGIARVDSGARTELAALAGESIYPLAQLLGDEAPATFADALNDWATVVASIATALDGPAASNSASDAAAARFLTPTVADPAIWCAGANYIDHVREMGAVEIDKRAYHFLSPVTALNSHRATVHPPREASKIDWEVELVAVIGRTARRVTVSDALSYVAGYTVANDISVRDDHLMRHPVFGIDWTMAKNADGMTPIGPAVVPAVLVTDPGNLRLWTTVNAELRQDSSTDQMIVSVPEQISALSQLVTLRPGDLVLTGTPAGTAAGHGGRYLGKGDVVVVSVDGVGRLQTTIG